MKLALGCAHEVLVRLRRTGCVTLTIDTLPACGDPVRVNRALINEPDRLLIHGSFRGNKPQRNVSHSITASHGQPSTFSPITEGRPDRRRQIVVAYRGNDNTVRYRHLGEPAPKVPEYTN
jgi:hypothetical protein